MSDRTATRRAALRDKLVELAEAQIKAEGLGSLRARALATQAGCSVGAIYTVFDDMTALVLDINGRTFRRLGNSVAEAVAELGEASPHHRLVAMSLAYLDFASQNTALWRALFDVEMSVDGPVPAWYMDALGGLFSHIAAPLAELNPEMPERELDLLTRGLFSAVHGIVLLGLEKRISAVPREHLEEMIAQILHKIS